MKLLLKNRYTVLLATIGLYLGAIVIEGTITGREPRIYDLDNSWFQFEVNNEEEFEALIQRYE